MRYRQSALYANSGRGGTKKKDFLGGNFEKPLTALSGSLPGFVCSELLVSYFMIPEKLSGDKTPVGGNFATILFDGTLAEPVIPERLRCSPQPKRTRKRSVKSSKRGRSPEHTFGARSRKLLAYWLESRIVALMSLGYLVSNEGP